MNSDNKAHAIFVVTMGVGVLGTILVGWLGLVAAAIAISAIALAPNTTEGEG